MTEEAKARQKARRKAYYQEHRTEILQKAARRRGNMSEEERRAFNQYQRRCYRNRREEILAKAKERYATDEKFRERALAYAAESADRIREYGAAYRKKNRDLLNEKNRKYIRFCKGKYSSEADAIRAWRLQRGYTLEKTAQLFGVGYTAVSNWENCRSRPPIERYLSMRDFAEWYENYKTKEE